MKYALLSALLSTLCLNCLTARADDLASIKLGKENKETGITLTKSEEETSDGYTVPGVSDGVEYRATHEKKGRYMYFIVDGSVPVAENLRVTVVAKSDDTDPSLSCGLTLTYETAEGYKPVDYWFGLPHDGDWHEHTFVLPKPDFAGKWGWHFRIDAISSAAPVEVKEVRLNAPEE